jgi:hypothetical protein
VFAQYVSFGLIGYLVFASTTDGVITLNMPSTPLFNAVLVRAPHGLI